LLPGTGNESRSAADYYLSGGGPVRKDEGASVTPPDDHEEQPDGHIARAS
jgi:hypothetical protein